MKSNASPSLTPSGGVKPLGTGNEIFFIRVVFLERV